MLDGQGRKSSVGDELKTTGIQQDGEALIRILMLTQEKWMTERKGI